MQTLKIKIANGIADFYEFSNYPITPEKIKDMATLIMDSWDGISESLFDKFIKEAKTGQCGMIFSSPVSFMVAVNDFKKRNVIPQFFSGPTR